MLTTRVRALELVALNVTLEVDLACACVWCVALGFGWALGFGFGLGRGLTTAVAAAAAVARGAAGRATGFDSAADCARRSLAGTRDANEWPNALTGEDGTTTGANCAATSGVGSDAGAAESEAGMETPAMATIAPNVMARGRVMWKRNGAPLCQDTARKRHGEWTAAPAERTRGGCSPKELGWASRARRSTKASTAQQAILPEAAVCGCQILVADRVAGATLSAILRSRLSGANRIGPMGARRSRRQAQSFAWRIPIRSPALTTTRTETCGFRARTSTARCTARGSSSERTAR